MRLPRSRSTLARNDEFGIGRGSNEIITRLAAMNLPVGGPEAMEAEIVLGRVGVKKKRKDQTEFTAD